jgi:hypothetical protein
MLQKLKFLPGFNKQVTATGGENQWIGGDYVRFRYGTPEKIGGWAQLGDQTLTGRNTALHHFVNASGIKYAALGTNRILYVYSGGAFYDITPLKSTNTLTNAFTTTQSDATVTITFASDHNISKGDIILLDTWSTITNSDFGASDFNDKNFQVATVPTSTTITVEMGSVESGSGATTSGGIRVKHYYSIGPALEESAAGWGLGLWGGTVAGEITDTLDGALTDSSTSIVLDNSASMPASGTVLIDSERIAYTANATGTGTLSGLTRGSDNTTAASHSDGATVYDASDYTKWGASQTGDVITAPGLWHLDNFGNKLIATIVDSATFEWDSDAASATSTRATLVANAPTAARQTLVSTPDRHLVFFGTETTIGTTSTQDDMFIRWSDQESIDASTSYAPSATNTAGTQRLADGTRIIAAIRGRDAIYVWTDHALFIMRFVGAPFVFSFQQVGTGCGLIGKNAAVEVDGSAYWMSENGFFRYTGKLESLACLVEDYVFDDLNTVPRNHIFAGLNNLFGEVTWFYPGSGAASNNRSVTYNYMDSTGERPVWTTSTLARSAWSDSHIFGKPHGTEYDADATSDSTVGNTDGVTVYYEHETGNNQIKAGSASAIAASIESGDFDIAATQGGGADTRGDGEYMMKVRRVLPDFLQQTGDARVTLNLKNYPTDSQASSSLGPFTTTTSTTKIDTRARARAISLKVDNTSTSQHWKLGTFRLDIQPDGRR